MGKIFRAIVLSLMAVVLLASPVMAYLYRAQISIVEDNGTAYTMLPVIVDSPNEWLIDNDFMEADGLDTKVQTLGGQISPHMMTATSFVTAASIPANSQTNLYFLTGDTLLSDFDIVSGYGGYITTLDHADLELGDEGSITLTDTYTDTSATMVGEPVFDKLGSITLLVPSAGNLTAGLYDTSVTLTQGAGATSVNMYSGAVVRFGQRYDAFPGGMLASLSFFLTKVNNPPGSVYFRVRLDDDTLLGTIGSMLASDIGGGGNFALDDNPVYIPAGSNVRFLVEYELGDAGNYIRGWYNAADTVSGVQTQYTAGGGWVDNAANDARFAIEYYDGSFSVSATKACATGEHDIIVSMDGANLSLSVDGSAQTAALGGNSATDTDYDWVWGSDAAPYFARIRLTQGVATDRIDYNPVDLIHGENYSTGTATFTNGSDAVVGAGTTWTSDMDGSVIWSTTDLVSHIVSSVTDNTHLTLTSNYSAAGGAGHGYVMNSCLVNEETANEYDGAITWGSNPAGVTPALGSMVSPTTYTSTGGTYGTTEHLPPVGTVDWNTEPDTTVTLLNHPLRPIIVAISDNTTFTERQVWIWFGIIFLVMVIAGVGTRVKGHQGITAIATAVAVTILVIWTIFPLQALIFVGILAIGGLVSERSHSL